MTEALNDAKKLYTDAISRIIYNNITLDLAQKLETELLGNLEKIAKTQSDKEGKLNKEEKTNKVERTMATQSLNVRVTAKLDLIQKNIGITRKLLIKRCTGVVQLLKMRLNGASKWDCVFMGILLFGIIEFFIHRRGFWINV